MAADPDRKPLTDGGGHRQASATGQSTDSQVGAGSLAAKGLISAPARAGRPAARIDKSALPRQATGAL